ncbi:MAG: hypothetical protein SYC29_04395 [Planctomycetota bacterium]|nr:hypothetical protein [Planctomycetota bacterium]
MSTIEPTPAPPPSASAPPRPAGEPTHGVGALDLIEPDRWYHPDRVEQDLGLSRGTLSPHRRDKRYFYQSSGGRLFGQNIRNWLIGEKFQCRVSDEAARIHKRIQATRPNEAKATAAPTPEPAAPRDIVERAAQMRGHVDEAAAKHYVELITAEDHSDDDAAELIELMRKLGISDEKAREHANVLAELRELEPKVASIEKLSKEHERANATAVETRDRLRPKIEELQREVESARRAVSAASSKLQAARHAASRVGWIKRNYPELFHDPKLLGTEAMSKPTAAA